MKNYTAIRGWMPSTQGVRKASSGGGQGRAHNLRVTLPRGQLRQLPAFVDLAKRTWSSPGVISGCGHRQQHASVVQIILSRWHAARLCVLRAGLASLERDHRGDSSASSREPRSCGASCSIRRRPETGGVPSVRLQAPEFSAWSAHRRVKPCFSFPGRGDAQISETVRARGVNLPCAGQRRMMKCEKNRQFAAARARMQNCVCSRGAITKRSRVRTELIRFR